MDPKISGTAPSKLRLVAAGGVVIVVSAYTWLVISGRIVSDDRVDAAHLGILLLAVIVVVALIHPSAFDRLESLEIAGLKLDLARVQEQQLAQERQLSNLKLILPLLLPETERTHLLALDRGETANYLGGHSLREELRRLRSIRLIQMRKGSIGDLKTNEVFDLADHVELTPLGRDWVRRIKDLEQVESPRGPGEDKNRIA